MNNIGLVSSSINIINTNGIPPYKKQQIKKPVLNSTIKKNQ